MTRTKNKTKMPSNSEEYRKAMKVEANAWLCMSSRYRVKPWLHGLSNASFSNFVEYILGDRVYNIQSFSSHKSCGVFLVLVEGRWTCALTYVLVRRVSLRLLNLDCRYPRDLLQPARKKKIVCTTSSFPLQMVILQCVYVLNGPSSCHTNTSSAERL